MEEPPSVSGKPCLRAPLSFLCLPPQHWTQGMKKGPVSGFLPYNSIYSAAAAALRANSSSYSVQAWEEWCRWIQLEHKAPFIPLLPPTGHTSTTPGSAAVRPNPDQVLYSLHIYLFFTKTVQNSYKTLVWGWAMTLIQKIIPMQSHQFHNLQGNR